MTYHDALALLDTLPRFADAGALAYKPGLERMHALLEALGNPHERLSFIHIAGTNGKGSTASLVAAIGTASGKRMGLHTSPHVFDFAERMRIDGIPAPHEWVASAISTVEADIGRIEPSYFELSVALSFHYFATEAVDMAVVEVGLGGRLDATNVIVPRVCAVTHIGLDHTDLLGDSLEAIAREKGGIAKPGIPLFSTVESSFASDVLRDTALSVGASFEKVRETVSVEIQETTRAGLIANVRTPLRQYKDILVGLPGRHQAWNAALAIRLAEAVWPDNGSAAVRDGLAEVIRYSGLRGRCEVVNEHPLVIADVAHNPDGWRAALEYADAKQNGKLFVLIGVMADKDVATLATILVDHDAIALPVGLPSSRAMSRSDLSQKLNDVGVTVYDVHDVEQGVAWFHAKSRNDDILLATGSHLMVSELLNHL